MAVDANRAAFVRKEFRYEQDSDAATKALFPNAQVIEINTNLEATPAAALVATILAVAKLPAIGWEVVIKGALFMDALDGTVPSYTASFPQYATDSRTYKVVGFDADYAADTTTLRLRG